MNEKAMEIKHPKRRGEWAEMRFKAAAAEHGLSVMKPWGETAQYDFIVEHQARYVRVQVSQRRSKTGADTRARCVRAGERMWETRLIL